jgi:hypothetical protein
MSAGAVVAALVCARLLQGADPHTKAPISFEHEEVDLGSFQTGATVEAAFRFTNGGTEHVQFTRVLSSCTCARATYPQGDVRPGAEGSIRISIDTGSAVGIFERRFMVTYRAGGATYTSYILARMKLSEGRGVVVEPATIRRGSLRPGTQDEVELVVTMDGSSDRDAPPIVTGPTWIDILAVRPMTKPGMWALSLALHAPDQLGEFAGRIRIRTRDGQLTPAAVPILGCVEGDVVVTPRSVVAVLPPGGPPRMVALTVLDRTGRPIRIVGTAFEKGNGASVGLAWQDSPLPSQKHLALTPRPNLFSGQALKDVLMIRVATGMDEHLLRVRLLFILTGDAAEGR